LSSIRPHLLAALGALLLMAPPVMASSPVAAKPKPPASTCAAPGPSSQVFLPQFADPAFYYLAPNASFEKSAWSGGTLAAGNEPFNVGGRGQKRSMSVTGPVTSPSMCIAFDAPTIRFFAQRTSGSPLSTLGISAIVPVAGLDVAVPLAPVSGLSSDWVLTPPTLILANLTNVADVVGMLDGRAATRVRFVLVPSPGSTWRVDDFYVDPYRRN
jgi:hypothetical protein